MRPPSAQNLKSFLPDLERQGNQRPGEGPEGLDRGHRTAATVGTSRTVMEF